MNSVVSIGVYKFEEDTFSMVENCCKKYFKKKI